MIMTRGTIAMWAVRMLAWGIRTYIRRIGVLVWGVGVLQGVTRRTINYMIRITGGWSFLL